VLPGYRRTPTPHPVAGPSGYRRPQSPYSLEPSSPGTFSNPIIVEESDSDEPPSSYETAPESRVPTPEEERKRRTTTKESKKPSTEPETGKYEQWEEAEDNLVESGRFNLEREVMLRPVIFIFFMDYLFRLVHSKAVYSSYPEHCHIRIALLCLSRTQPSTAFLIYGYTDSIAQRSTATQVLYEYNSLTQYTRQYN
jgi:hypothetical protein